MNEKFEKWFEEDGKHRMCGIREAQEIWESAIQSLEVTPELRDVLCDAIANMFGAYANEDDCEVILRSLVSALKEQAK